MHLFKRLAIAMVLPLAACAVGPSNSLDTGLGASPAIPAPESSLIPMVNIAPVRTRPPGFMPSAPAGFTVTQFASGLAHPRWLYTLPNGDVLVAESDAPKEHDKGSGLFGWIRRQVMKRAAPVCRAPTASCLCAQRRRAVSRKCRQCFCMICTRRSAWRSSEASFTLPTRTPAAV